MKQLFYNKSHLSGTLSYILLLDLGLTKHVWHRCSLFCLSYFLRYLWILYEIYIVISLQRWYRITFWFKEMLLVTAFRPNDWTKSRETVKFLTFQVDHLINDMPKPNQSPALDKKKRLDSKMRVDKHAGKNNTGKTCWLMNSWINRCNDLWTCERTKLASCRHKFIYFFVWCVFLTKF